MRGFTRIGVRGSAHNVDVRVEQPRAAVPVDVLPTDAASRRGVTGPDPSRSTEDRAGVSFMGRRDIKAIETEYDGYRFRSRTEAKWAVFFNGLGIEWEYEPEGFQLGKYRRYLPDFLLPTIGVNGTWLEVKGQDPTAAEERRCQDLANGTGQRVLLAIRPPFPPSLKTPQKSGSMRCYFPNREMADRDDSDRGFAFFECEMCGHIDVAWPGLAYGCFCELPETATPSRTPRILAAYAACRSERFGT